MCVTMTSSPALRELGPVLPTPSRANCWTLPPRKFHSTAEPSEPLTSIFIDEWGLMSLNALNAPVTFASFPKAYMPARE